MNEIKNTWHITESYPDGDKMTVNVSVTLEMDNGDRWFVQTDNDGFYRPQNNCEIWLNDDNDQDFSEHQDFEQVIEMANAVAADIHSAID